jgi:hypothetical protein
MVIATAHADVRWVEQQGEKATGRPGEARRPFAGQQRMEVTGLTESTDDRAYWVPSEEAINHVRGLESDPAFGTARVRQTLAEIGRKLAAMSTEDAALPGVLGRWRHLAALGEARTGTSAIADDLKRRIETLFPEGPDQPPVNERSISEAARWVEAAQPLATLFGGPLLVEVERAGRRVDLQMRRLGEAPRLASFQPRRDAIGAFDRLLDDPSNDEWALHICGAGGAGKTMVLRHLAAAHGPERGAATARIDFDYLHPDYPARTPALLLVSVAEELRLQDDGKTAQSFFQSFEYKVREFHDRLATGAPIMATGDPLEAVNSGDFQSILQTFADAARALQRRPVLLLDTCEELGKLREDEPARLATDVVPAAAGQRPNVVATFLILERLHYLLPSVRVVFAGRRPLAAEGADGWRAVKGAGLPTRPYLRLCEIFGFDAGELQGYIERRGNGERLGPPVVEAIRDGSREPGLIPAAPDGPERAATAQFTYPTSTCPKVGERFSPYEVNRLVSWALADPGYDLRLMSSVKDMSAIPTSGKHLVIVAAVDHGLHFRIFDHDGKMVVDTDATQRTAQTPQVEDLRKQLENLWPPHELTTSEKGPVIDAVTSIVGHTPDPHVTPEAIRRSDPDQFIQERIVGQVRHPVAREILPGLALLGEADEATLLALSADPAVGDAVRELQATEWTDVSGGFIRVGPRLSKSLLKYYEAAPRAHLLAALRGRAAAHLEAFALDPANFDSLDPRHLDGLLRCLDEPGSAARLSAWWVQFERLAASRRSYDRVRQWSDHLLGEDGAARSDPNGPRTANPLRPAVLALRAAVFGQQGAFEPAARDWDSVAQTADQHPDPDVVARLRHRAVCGRVVARAALGVVNGDDVRDWGTVVDEVVSLLKTSATDIPRADAAESVLSAVLATGEALVESAEAREQEGAPDHRAQAGLLVGALPSFVHLADQVGSDGPDLQLMSWGDGSGMPTSGNNLVIAGLDNSGLLHIRTFDAAGVRTDTFEATDSSGALKLESTDASGNVLPNEPKSSRTVAQSAAITTLKQQLPGLLPPHVLSSSERERVLSEVTSISGHTRPVATDPRLQGFAASLCGRALFLDESQTSAAVPLNWQRKGLERVRGYFRNRNLWDSRSPGGWIDWPGSEELADRICLEFLSFAYPSYFAPGESVRYMLVAREGTHFLETAPDQLPPFAHAINLNALDEILPEPETVDGDRLGGAILRLLAAETPLPLGAVHRLSVAGDTPAASIASLRLAHRMFPRRAVAEAEAVAAVGGEGAIARLERLAKSTQDPGAVLDAHRAILRIHRRMRLFDRLIPLELDRAAVTEGYLAVRQAIGALDRPRVQIAPPPIRGLGGGPLSPRLRHAYWQAVFAPDARVAADAIEWAIARLSDPDRAMGNEVESHHWTLDRFEARLLAERFKLRRMKQRLRTGEQSLAELWRWVATSDSPGDSLSIILRLDTLTGGTSTIPADPALAGWHPLVARVGARRAAEIALNDGELLALRLPQQASRLLARARGWFSDCGDSTGALLAQITRVLCFPRFSQSPREVFVDAEEQLLRERFETMRLLDFDFADASAGWDELVQIAAAADEQSFDRVVRSWWWGAWLVRIIAFLCWRRDRLRDEGRGHRLASWFAQTYAPRSGGYAGLPAELYGWLDAKPEKEDAVPSPEEPTIYVVAVTLTPPSTVIARLLATGPGVRTDHPIRVELDWTAPYATAPLSGVAESGIAKVIRPGVGLQLHLEKDLCEPAWEAILARAGHELDREGVPFDVYRSLVGSKTPRNWRPARDVLLIASDPLEVESIGRRWREWTARSGGNYSTASFNDFSSSDRMRRARSSELTDAIVHLIGTPVRTNTGVGFLPTGSASGQGGQDLLYADRVTAPVPGAVLCVVQVAPPLSGPRTTTDRERAGLARRFAAELASRGVPLVVIIPALPEPQNAALLTRIADVVGSATSENVLERFLAAVRLMKEHALEALTGGPQPLSRDDAEEVSHDFCLYETRLSGHR